MSRKLTEADVLRLRRQFYEGVSHQQLAKAFGITVAHVTRIIVGVRYGTVQSRTTHREA